MTPEFTVVEMIGGPADGLVGAAAGARDGIIQLVEAPFRLPDGRPTFAMYRLTCTRDYGPNGAPKDPPNWHFIHIGVTDEQLPFVEREVRCANCWLPHTAVMPESAEFPLQCSGCGKIACWPKK